jgi:hypothetical protein
VCRGVVAVDERPADTEAPIGPLGTADLEDVVRGPVHCDAKRPVRRKRRYRRHDGVVAAGPSESDAERSPVGGVVPDDDPVALVGGNSSTVSAPVAASGRAGDRQPPTSGTAREGRTRRRITTG